jgi:hypothetical protein
LGLEGWTSEILSVIGWETDDDTPPRDRRAEGREDFCGHKVIVRQRRSLGILHLKDVSSRGVCGLTDMPLAVGSMVFLGLGKPHFRAAEVLWTRRLTVGLQWFRPLKPELLEKLHAAHVAARAERENWGVRQ